MSSKSLRTSNKERVNASHHHQVPSSGTLAASRCFNESQMAAGNIELQGGVVINPRNLSHPRHSLCCSESHRRGMSNWRILFAESVSLTCQESAMIDHVRFGRVQEISQYSKRSTPAEFGDISAVRQLCLVTSVQYASCVQSHHSLVKVECPVVIFVDSTHVHLGISHIRDWCVGIQSAHCPHQVGAQHLDFVLIQESRVCTAHNRNQQ